MTQDDPRFDFSLDLDAETEFDALDVVDEDDDDEDYDEEPGAIGIRDFNEQQTPEPVVKIDDRTPEERTADLFKSMAPYRKILLGVLSFCKEPKTTEQASELVEELKKSVFAVYEPAVICAHLEKAGALALVGDDGEPYREEDPEPSVVVIDGVEYLEPSQPAASYWQTTQIGLDVLDADKPLERLNDLFEAESAYLPIFKLILEMCDREGGATSADLSAAIDKHPLVQSPRRLSPYFSEKLEKCDALEWRKGWATTEVGRSALEILKDVEAAIAVEAAADPKRPTAPAAAAYEMNEEQF